MCSSHGFLMPSHAVTSRINKFYNTATPPLIHFLIIASFKIIFDVIKIYHLYILYMSPSLSDLPQLIH